MPASIGVNLRVTGHCRQGGRKYMEDFFSVAYQQTEDEKDLEYAFFGIYDGHGGAEAAAFAKEHLMETIIKHKNFWSYCDADVLRAIKDGYIATHYAMWREQEKWPRTASGLPSTAGTTASVAFIRRGKIYIGHVGDSGIILGYQEPASQEWKAKPLTRDHKPENIDEMSRIEHCGGKVVAKSGVPRVVWNRPKIGHQGPVRRSTPIDEIPFLAVARSLGDLWSYNTQTNQFIVSPDPDCIVLEIDTSIHRCLIFGTDGLYNMLSPSMAVHIVQQAERHNENAALSDSTYKTWLNPSKLLVEKALERWHTTKMRADNTSVVTLMLDPPGPPRAQVLKDRKKSLPETGLKIMTRYDDGNSAQENNCKTCDSGLNNESCDNAAQTVLDIVPEPQIAVALATVPENSIDCDQDKNKECPTATSESIPVSSSDLNTNFPLKERNFLPNPRESTSLDTLEQPAQKALVRDNEKENVKSPQIAVDSTIQCNEVSSSNIEPDSTCSEQTETESAIRNGKHNLRSAKKGTSEVASPVKTPASRNEGNRKGPKRKFELEENTTAHRRKSMRLDENQKKVALVEKENKKASKAEEKLKKLREKPEPAKWRSNMPKLSLDRKKLKCKNVEMKKKNAIKKPISKKKLFMVLEKVKRIQKSSLSTKSPKVQPAKIEKKKPDKVPNKVIATKVAFQRQIKNNSSLNQRNKSIPKTTDKKVKVTNKILKPKEMVIKIKHNYNKKKALESVIKEKGPVVLKVAAQRRDPSSSSDVQKGNSPKKVLKAT